MDLNLVKKLINLVEKHDIQELEVQEGELKVRITKSKVQEFMPGAIQFSPPQKPETAPVLEERKETTNLAPIKAPMVGTFYRAPAPDAPPYVGVGDTVTPGKVVCIIEAMKVMNEIESEISGKIVKVLVENEKPVEFGQELFLVEAI
ncbi:acetyl-CoA carboxylase, biotin carboxyl carrier protein [candidate division WOR-3 bacterium JGI_Cruoil_03_44_89]|uniref:Biotin carboxyl carrier protein of acetyl-CoA carboxylase n=1 Tax=candidate division WOR-3 bacterium JGI_Cruoil_03_44_89 TaxID=1973748 RepID=A0A235BTM9_UNCW3|nr:MAG: acetyl-CoA carboxylase, biotin carboxyl carrier protein [candidate division WOR-3 bacterium JGI_Cruoil_03_44_89]